MFAMKLRSWWNPEPVKALQLAHGRVTGVVAAGGTTSVEHAVLAAGVWSPQLRGLPRDRIGWPEPVHCLTGTGLVG